LRAKIWDHAGGLPGFRNLAVHVTNLDGKELDFMAGRRLKANRGMIVARQHAAVIFNIVREFVEIDGGAT